MVAALRENPRIDELDLRPGDHVLAVGDHPITRSGDLVFALLEQEKLSRPLALRIERDDLQQELTAGPLAPGEAVLLAEDIALAIDPDSTAIAVAQGSPAAAAGLLDGDRVERIDGVPTESWSTLQRLTHDAARQNASLVLNVHRLIGGELRSLEIEATPAAIPLPSYGFGIEDSLYVYRAKNLLQAAKLGVSHSAKFMIDAWTTLKRIGQGRVSGESIGGIITIASVSYSWTALGLSKLLFFLCVLSLNLAFINVLPIPVLDGGHLFFLLIEKIKGSPVSERVFGYSQLVGMVMILTLMIYVMYNDIMRFMPPN
jgi:regulator of sigma E protease